MSHLPALARFFTRVQALKRVPRSGWIDRGVPLPDVESVADHTWQTALIAWLTAVDGTTLEANRVLQLAMIHDLAEVIVGDQPPYAAGDVPNPGDRTALEDFFSRRHVRSVEAKALKREAENRAFADLVADLAPGMKELLVGLWDEYEAQATPEARFVKQADTLEAYLQSRHYVAVDPSLPMDGFRQMADIEITQPEMLVIRDAVGEP
jgi:putative hydrolases of HD superfamily